MSIWSDLQRYLLNIDKHFPSYTSLSTRISITCYSLYVLTKNDEDVSAKALQLFSKHKIEEFSLEALGWLLVALNKNNSKTKSAITKILKHLQNNVNETSETANFITSYGDDGKYVMLHSDQRTDAVLLDAFLEVDPKNSLVVKLTKGLLANKKKGRWNNTQENCLVLLALNKYFSIYEKDKPNFTTNMWFGQDYAGKQEWKKRETETKVLKIPMKKVIEEDQKSLIIQKEGKGRLYYRIGLNYAPNSLSYDSFNQGFFVERSYHSVDDKEDVRKDEKGVWHFKAGKRVKVKVDFVTTSRRYHVALVDKLPAGLEIINPSLYGDSGNVVVEPQNNSPYLRRGYYNPSLWYEHKNFRDERAEAFQSLLWEGKYSFEFIARATTKGDFVVPPSHIEEMYSPEIFGRSSSDKVIIS